MLRVSCECLADVLRPVLDANDNSGQPPWELSFRKSRWFTRGWPLQELVALGLAEFLSSNWIVRDLWSDIPHEVTRIPVKALCLNPVSPSECYGPRRRQGTLAARHFLISICCSSIGEGQSRRWNSSGRRSTKLQGVSCSLSFGFINYYLWDKDALQC